MTLEQEAEEYAESINKNLFGMRIYERYRSTKQDFIAGANSKWVQVEKIKYALEQLYKFREATFGKGKNVIEELEQQLKQLEDETLQ